MKTGANQVPQVAWGLAQRSQGAKNRANPGPELCTSPHQAQIIHSEILSTQSLLTQGTQVQTLRSNVLGPKPISATSSLSHFNMSNFLAFVFFICKMEPNPLML